MYNIKTIKQRGIAIGNKAMSIPNKVPIPLPPLKPANIVYECPRTDEKPKIIYIIRMCTN